MFVPCSKSVKIVAGYKYCKRNKIEVEHSDKITRCLQFCEKKHLSSFRFFEHLFGVGAESYQKLM